MYLSKIAVFVFVTLALFEIELTSARSTHRGKCTKDSKYKCTKYGFFEVKQCKKGEWRSKKCHCVDSWDGILHKKVQKEEDCPACLLANAESHKMTAEGWMDMNIYDCDSEGYYSSDPQCFWYGWCVCYTNEGEVTKEFDVRDMTGEELEKITCDGAESGKE